MVTAAMMGKIMIRLKLKPGDGAHIHAKETGVKVGNGAELLGSQAGIHTTGKAGVDCFDQAGLGRCAVGGNAKCGAGGADGVLGDAENVLHRAVNNLHHAEQDQHIDKHRQAACSGGVAILLLELDHFLLHFFLVVLVLLLDFIDHRCKHRHLGHGLLLFDHQRKHEQFDDHGENNHRDGEVRDHLIQHTHQRSQDHCEESHILSFRPARTQGIYFIKKVFAVR